MEDVLKRVFNVAEKWILITGANGFFGRYMAKGFLSVGAKVVLLGRSPHLLDQAGAYRREFGEGSVLAFLADFYNREQLREVLFRVRDAAPVDVIINNAYDLSERTGFNTPKGRFENCSYEEWQNAFESGIYWAVQVIQVLGEGMRKRKRGSIVNISSMYGVVSPNPLLYEGRSFMNPPTYGVNKAGLIALTRYLAAFWGKDGIRCNAILPGAFPNVESTTANSVNREDTFMDRLRANTVLGRVGHPDDLLGILLYLASDASSYMTGQTIVIDGGWTLT